MSGIYGLFHRDGAPVEPETLERLAASMSQWGPDGAGCWSDGRVGLGHLMLFTTPESLHEKLPATHPAAPDHWITADARIDNREELFAALGVAGPEQRCMADSALILLAYARWGELCVERLLGDFAFAIWDGPRRRLFCARDHMGGKPFFYHLGPRLFVFASDIRSVLAHPALEPRLNEPLLAAYLQRDIYFAEKKLTFFEGILRLPPAHRLLITPAEARLEEYWTPRAAPPLRLASDTEYEERLRELLRSAVACRVRSAFPVGSHLSGGLDSTTIAVLAQRELRQAGRSLTAAFSWSPPGVVADDDEHALIEAVASREGIHCHYIELTVENGAEQYLRDITTDPTEELLRELLVQRQAAAQGVRVILSGWGGDEGISFNGRGYLAELFLRGHWLTLHREALLASASSSQRGTARLRAYAGTMRSKVLQPILPEKLAALLDRSALSRLELPTFIHPDFARRHEAAVRELAGPSLRERAGLHAMQICLLTAGHLSKRIEAWAISGAARRIEYRYPLLDRRILEFALGIPAEQFYRQGWRRYLFRRATAGILPDQLRWKRSKSDLAAFAALDNLFPQLLPALLAAVRPEITRHRAAAYVEVERLAKEATAICDLDARIVAVARALSCFHVKILAAPA